MNRMRIAMAFGLALGCALTACGGPDEAQKAREATEATVESAPQAGGQPAGEDTQATVESAPGGEEPKDE